MNQNRLAQETSPYLLQHADNPVNWYAWGEEALKKARDEDKPILLSIGYSACHWCHVMAHESFEDQETASLMNELFINIKVDREERPDLDKIYQRAHQLLAQRAGGWPLTVFLMPDDRVPFFAGTYFPREPRYNLPSFRQLLKRVSEFYHSRRHELEEQNRSLIEAMQSLSPVSSQEDIQLTPAPLDVARRQLESSMDWTHGGFGQAPKFPHPTNLERLLRHWASSGMQDARALEMACFTLDKMGEGGINDQLGGGFCRYSVDDYWMIPHFEKMLYDNGPLLALYSEAWAATDNTLYKEIVESTSQWVLREMQSPEGGYYSSLDADSEGEEGKFYSWTKEQVKDCLDKKEFTLFSLRYGLNLPANFEGKWYPHVFADWEKISHQVNLPVDEISETVQQARKKLFNAREQRVRPGRDDKILTSWNALMIKGLAMAGRYLGKPELIESAYRAMDFIQSTLWQEHRLLATYKDGKAHLNAYLDDYVFLIDAIIELLQAQWKDGALEFAITLADTVLEQFEDPDAGGFFFTSNDHENLIDRPKPMGDESTPSGNGVAAIVLGRLGHILGETRYLDAAERTLKMAWNAMTQLPYAHCSLLQALEETLYPVQTIVIRGKQDDLEKWHRRCATTYAPRRITLAIPDDATALPDLLQERKASANETLAYICSGHACSAPVSDFEKLEASIRDTEYHVQAPG
jgi:uncharacterized protein YyaL (SSP411 family)